MPGGDDVVPPSAGVADDLAVGLGDDDVGRRVAALKMVIGLGERRFGDGLTLAIGDDAAR